jgi:hypothetical protein
MLYDKSKDSTIELLGITGLVGSVASAIQQLLMSRHYLLSISAVVIYGIGFAGYLLFMKMKSISVLLLLISAALMFIEQAFLFAIGAVLWLSLLLMLFSIIVLAVIYMQELKNYIVEIEKDQSTNPWD